MATAHFHPVAGRPMNGELSPEDEPADQEQPIPGRCGARTRSRGLPGGARGPYCRLWPLRGETRCKLHGGAGNAAKRGRPSSTLKHGLRSRFLDKEGATFYQVARTDIDATGGVDTLADMAAFTVAKIQVHARRSADDEAIDQADAMLRAQLTARHLIETRHKIERERLPKTEDHNVTVVIPQFLARQDEGDGRTAPKMVKHITGEMVPTMVDLNGQLLIQGLDKGWHVAVAIQEDNGERCYWTNVEKAASEKRHRPFALLDPWRPEDAAHTNEGADIGAPIDHMSADSKDLK